jgi:hypothetical protein
MKNVFRAVAATLVLSSCSSPLLAQTPGEVEIRQGMVEQITATQIQSNHHRGIGAVVGGLALPSQTKESKRRLTPVRHG